MISIVQFVLWITSFISSIVCAAVGFIGTGMGNDGLTFWGVHMMASPIIVTMAGVFALWAENWATVLMLNIIFMVPVVQIFPLLGSLNYDIVNLLYSHK